MPSSLSILKPLFAQAALSFAVVVWLAALRLFAIYTKKIPMTHFQLMRGAHETPAMVQASRNYINLFESPVLFFAVGILYYVTNQVTTLAIDIAWAYVILRIAHSLIHLTFNEVNLRFISFLGSQVCLVALWVMLGKALF